MLFSGKGIIIFELHQNKKSGKNLSPIIDIMIHFATQLSKEFIQHLESVVTNGKSEIEIASEKLDISTNYLSHLEEFIKTVEFKNEKEEIHFFKYVKPKFLSRSYYYSVLTYTYSHMPAGDRKTKINFIKKVIKKNNSFISENQRFFSYYKLKQHSEDHIYFLKSAKYLPLYPDFSFEASNNFNNINSTILSKLIAYEEVNDCLSSIIDSLLSPYKPLEHQIHLEEKSAYPIKWCGSKAELTELLYAVHSNGNFGEVAINKVMETFEDVLQVNMGNYYRNFLDLSMRKKSRTPYLDNITKSLEKKFDDSY